MGLFLCAPYHKTGRNTTSARKIERVDCLLNETPLAERQVALEESITSFTRSIAQLVSERFRDLNGSGHIAAVGTAVIFFAGFGNPDHGFFCLGLDRLLCGRFFFNRRGGYGLDGIVWRGSGGIGLRDFCTAGKTQTKKQGKRQKEFQSFLFHQNASNIKKVRGRSHAPKNA